MIPSAQIERTSRSLHHCIAECRECDWRDEDYIRAARNATQHVRRTGHQVHVEQGISYVVRVRKPRNP